MTDINASDIQPCKPFAEANPNIFPNKSSLEWMIRNRDTNGLAASGAYVLIGNTGHFIVPKLMAHLVAKAA
jgi:hypothetical protein